MKCFAFDVDECLEISKGPVTLASLRELRAQGHIVGICGNMNVICQVPDWHTFISFLGQGVVDGRHHTAGMVKNGYTPFERYPPAAPSFVSGGGFYGHGGGRRLYQASNFLE